ncbi:phosphonate ABC transporter, permease protein PhnE [Saccharopolyspora sp. WRP15-2]|uniref:Phosphonate ABC transporter, permease protein PhnE n=1 Tax=Saccharopolyspora oryzae TaxID=2997343 RepID=A0ABT4UW08_9PSEU|nr:phosphonate ABC transporter, permease protein PhnE [Saccharopolyspora oryzae]MDA3625880.1 phosphonate ABC transporter, permease protein PhnE [Saccharopolyspora oryzae]
MTITAEQPRRTLARPTPAGSAAAVVVLALLGAAIWAFVSLRLNVATFVDGAANAVDFAARTVPLDFPPLGELLALCGQTLAIVVCATLLASLISAPVAVLAARNTSLGGTSRLGARVIIVVARAIPDVVLAIVFFRMFGFGGLTGVLAMGLHSIGMIGKLYADAIEQIDEGPRTAIRAAGGTRLQQLVGGVLPQVMPSFVATSLHRLDINLRVSVVLGFVGVGGLGQAISDALRTLDYQRGMALASVVFLLCVLVEVVSGAIRRGLLGVREERRSPLRRRVQVPAPREEGVVSGKTGSNRLSPSRPISPPWTPARVRRSGYWLLTALVVAASIWGADISFDQFQRAITDFGPTLALFWPPETGGVLAELLAELLVTIQIALAATLIGAVLALPVGALAANNVAPNPAVAKFFRGVVLAVRGVPELVLAIVFVVITGLGGVAGALALGVGSVGLLGKLVADSLEEVDRGKEQALRAAGATRLQVFFAATVPQAAPAFVGHVLYQLDTNLRSATLLGLVGAGGIGYYLLNASRVLEFGVVTTVLVLTFAVVMLVELLAIWLRRVVR